MSQQTEKLPSYRLLTGPDDATFCNRISEMLERGYELYGNPAIAWNGDEKKMIAAQALVRRLQKP